MIKIEYNDGHVRFLNPSKEFFSISALNSKALDEAIIEKAQSIAFSTGIPWRITVIVNKDKILVKEYEKFAPVKKVEIPSKQFKAWKRKRIARVKEARKELINPIFTTIWKNGITRILKGAA